MKPILFSFGPFHIYSFGALVALGVVVAMFLMTRRARRDGFPQEKDVADLVFVTVLAGFLGSRAYYVFQNWAWYVGHPAELFAFWQGGLIYYGGVVLAMAALFFAMRAKRIPYLKGLDFLFTYLPLVHGFGRLGCFLNGCCYGRPWDGFCAVQFPDLPSPVHPTQLYEATFDFVLFLYLSRRYSRKRIDGDITAQYLIFYALGRFGIEFVRGDNPGWGLLSWNQWVSLGFMALGMVFYLWRKRFDVDTSHSGR